MGDLNENIISAVRGYTSLWNVNDSKYHSRNVQQMLWQKVAEEVDSDVATVKRKWRSLRDTYRRKCNQMLKAAQAPDEEAHTAWAYFELMSFISSRTTQPQRRQRKGSLAESIGGASAKKEFIFEPMDTLLENELQSSAVTDHVDQGSQAVPSLSTQRKRHARNGSNSSSAIANAKRAAARTEVQCEEMGLTTESAKSLEDNRVQRDDDDDDLSFFRSLLPYMRNVPRKRKLILRKKILDIFINDSEPEEGSD